MLLIFTSQVIIDLCKGLLVEYVCKSIHPGLRIIADLFIYDKTIAIWNLSVFNEQVILLADMACPIILSCMYTSPHGTLPSKIYYATPTIYVNKDMLLYIMHGISSKQKL